MSGLEDNVSGNGTESENEIEVSEEGQDDLRKRCTNCDRPMVLHRGKCGRSCTKERLEGEYLLNYEAALRERLKKRDADKAAKNKGKTTGVEGGVSGPSKTGQKKKEDQRTKVTEGLTLDKLKEMLAQLTPGQTDLSPNVQQLGQASPQRYNQPPPNMYYNPMFQQWQYYGQGQPQGQFPQPQGQFQQPQGQNGPHPGFGPGGQYQQQPVQQQQQPQGPQFQPQMQFMQPLAVPKFVKTLSMDGWMKSVKVWILNHSWMQESMKLGQIMASLMTGERKDLANWVQGLYEDPNFDMNKNGILEEFFNTLQEKFETPGWTKCRSIWKEFIEVKAEEGKPTREYVEKFEQLEQKIKNQGEQISPVYLEIHFLENARLCSHTLQAILGKVDLENRTTVLKEVKKAYEILVKTDDSNETYWGQNERGRSRERRPDNRKDDRRERRDYDREDRREEGDERREERRERSRNGRGRRSSNYRQRGSSRSHGRSNSRFRERSRNQSRGREYRGRSRDEPREVYTCEKFEMESADERGDENTVFVSEAEDIAVIDSGCPKSVMGSLWSRIHQQRIRNVPRF